MDPIWEPFFLYEPISTSFEVPKKRSFHHKHNTFQILYLAEAPHSENLFGQIIANKLPGMGILPNISWKVREIYTPNLLIIQV